MEEQDASPARTELREKILSAPKEVLEDRDIMRALIAADSDERGSNVVDLRSIALERLEDLSVLLRGDHPQADLSLDVVESGDVVEGHAKVVPVEVHFTHEMNITIRFMDVKWNLWLPLMDR